MIERQPGGDQVWQRLTIQKFHRDQRQTVFLLDGIDRANIRVAKRARRRWPGEHRLAQVFEIAPEHLEGNASLQARSQAANTLPNEPFPTSLSIR